MSRLAILLGAGNAALAIVFGAFAAHGLRNFLSEKMLSIFLTAVDYHLYHGLGLIVVGLLLAQSPISQLLKVSVWMMLIGIIIFCGSLYGLSLSGITWLGMITPIGGISFIVSWVLIVVAYINKPSNE